MSLEARLEDCLKKSDPIDSLFFDVSVARHMMEGGQLSIAREWLDGHHALLELRRSREAGFFSREEADEVLAQITSITMNLGSVPAMRTIVELQDALDRRAHWIFLECVGIRD